MNSRYPYTAILIPVTAKRKLLRVLNTNIYTKVMIYLHESRKGTSRSKNRKEVQWDDDTEVDELFLM